MTSARTAAVRAPGDGAHFRVVTAPARSGFRTRDREIPAPATADERRMPRIGRTDHGVDARRPLTCAECNLHPLPGASPQIPGERYENTHWSPQ